jgi:catechol 2,3-dioxygenase-like lactoylglutathione lyase family enzyme
MQIHRGRLIDHVHLVVADFNAAARFYAAALEPLGIPLGAKGDDFFWYDELFVSSPRFKGATGTLTGRHHLAFRASDRRTVEQFHAAAVAAGGTDNGGPGERPYHAGYYAAFVLDPAGNNIEAVYHGPAKAISASSIVIDL